jgi:hypothetical protein
MSTNQKRYSLVSKEFNENRQQNPLLGQLARRPALHSKESTTSTLLRNLTTWTVLSQIEGLHSTSTGWEVTPIIGTTLSRSPWQPGPWLEAGTISGPTPAARPVRIGNPRSSEPQNLESVRAEIATTTTTTTGHAPTRPAAKQKREGRPRQTHHRTPQVKMAKKGTISQHPMNWDWNLEPETDQIPNHQPSRASSTCASSPWP